MVAMERLELGERLTHRALKGELRKLAAGKESDRLSPSLWLQEKMLTADQNRLLERRFGARYRTLSTVEDLEAAAKILA